MPSASSGELRRFEYQENTTVSIRPPGILLSTRSNTFACAHTPRMGLYLPPAKGKTDGILGKIRRLRQTRGASLLLCFYMYRPVNRVNKRRRGVRMARWSCVRLRKFIMSVDAGFSDIFP